jgi:predicted GNAT family N-acyltransferase
MPLTIQQVAFTDPEFEACFALRLEVFVHEQNVPPEDERDEHEETALHFLARHEQKPVGTARVLLKPDGVKITRVAVKKSARGLGIGAALMRHIEANVAAEKKYVLDAQTQALPFYQALGYQAVGDEFMECGIPHFRMVKNVKS